MKGESGVFVADNQDTSNDNAGKEKEMQNVFHVAYWASPLVCEGPAVSNVVTIAAIESKVVTLTGKLGGATVNIFLDSGSSISLVRKAALQVAENVRVITLTTIIQLVTAAGVDYVTAPIQVLYNSNNEKCKKPDGLSTFLPIIQKAKSTSHFAAATKSQDKDVVDECAIPKFGNLVASFELPECPRSELRTVVDLQSGYWQLPVYAKDREKTAFCPGPGMELYQFTVRIPFGLTGAPSSFQRLMDTVMRGLWFFLGLASYYRPYVNVFAAIAAPLHFLTQKDTPFNWTTECDAAFQTLKQILCRPQYRLTLGLNKQIEYKKGSQNRNVDALSRRSVGVITHAGQALDDMRKAQRDDPAISIVYTTLLSKNTPTHSGKWRQHPLRRYRQLWSQLQLIDGIVCRQYAPSPASDVISVPVLPESLQREALQRNHNAPSACHQGVEKTLQRLKQKHFGLIWQKISISTAASVMSVNKQNFQPQPQPQPQ
eukprot:Em0003g1320a